MAGNRKLFEEVGDAGTARSAAQPGLIDRGRGGARGAIRIWLMVLFVLVVTMIAVGGLTRLTDSGLSITEWDPVMGALPPMSAQDWQSEFEKYQETDEFRIQNSWMDIEDFKPIYLWEWGHRNLGRLVGLVWALGFAWFALRRQIPVGWSGKLALPGLLGALQGGVGWWMVSSGVTPGEGALDVASERLAFHLGLAFVILGIIAWYIFELGREARLLMQARRAREAGLWAVSTGLMHFAFLQILIGALVAGIDAGRSYTDWPLMGGHFVPVTAFTLEPFWRNFLDNPGLVQFIHRMTGYALFAFAVFAWTRGRRSSHPRTRLAFNAVLAAMSLQILLGIVTVLYGAPAEIAILHQLMAVAVWVLILRARFLSGYPIATSLRGR
ncbi:heme A synthase [Sulfitobacter sp. LCG007]